MLTLFNVCDQAKVQHEYDRFQKEAAAEKLRIRTETSVEIARFK